MLLIRWQNAALSLVGYGQKPAYLLNPLKCFTVQKANNMLTKMLQGLPEVEGQAIRNEKDPGKKEWLFNLFT